MRSIRRAAVAALAAAPLLWLNGCELLDPDVCTAVVMPGIEVQVYDSVSGQVAAVGARGYVQDGAYVDSLRPYRFMASDPSTLYALSAAPERPGRYDVVVEKEGYRTWTRSDVRVDDGRCHVRSAVLRAELAPLDSGS